MSGSQATAQLPEQAPDSGGKPGRVGRWWAAERAWLARRFAALLYPPHAAGPIEVLGVLVAGVFMAWFVDRIVGISGTAVAVACLVLPALVVLAFSGRLSEISVGGLSAKLREAERQPVSRLMVGEVLSVAGAITKGTLDELDRWIRRHQPDRQLPIILTLQLGAPYAYDVFRRYLDRLRRTFPNFMFVVVTDAQGGYLCHTRPAAFVPPDRDIDIDRTFYNPESVHRFLTDVREADASAVRRFPLMQQNATSMSTPLSEALANMRAGGDEALLVLDEQRHPRGVLEQVDALKALLAAVTS